MLQGAGKEYSFLVPRLLFARPVRPLYNNRTYDQTISITRQADSAYNEEPIGEVWDRISRIDLYFHNFIVRRKIKFARRTSEGITLTRP